MTRSRRRSLAAWAVVATALALAWLAASGPPASGALEEEEPPAEESDRGDTLYTRHCARCHSADGSGRANERAPALKGMEAARVDLVLRTGRMPPADEDGSGKAMEWNDTNRETLVEHMTAVFDLEGPLLEPELGDPAAGREVFATHCAACHGYTGDGGVAGAGALTPRIVGLDPVVIAEAIRVGPFQMPAFVEEQVSDEEIGDIAAYLTEIVGEETTPLGLGELNPVFLAAFVGLLALAMILSCLFIAGRVSMFPDPEADEPDEAPEATDGHDR